MVMSVFNHFESVLSWFTISEGLHLLESPGTEKKLGRCIIMKQLELFSPYRHKVLAIYQGCYPIPVCGNGKGVGTRVSRVALARDAVGCAAIHRNEPLRLEFF